MPDENDPNAPVRVVLSGGSHDGLPPGLLLGSGTYEALRYPDGHLELVGFDVPDLEALHAQARQDWGDQQAQAEMPGMPSESAPAPQEAPPTAEPPTDTPAEPEPASGPVEAPQDAAPAEVAESEPPAEDPLVE